MRITAFLESESSEPVTVEHDVDTGLGEDGEEYSFGQLVSDVFGNRSLDDIDVVSENAITIALHALHGVLRATERGHLPNVLARDWALAGLRELAFYDLDGLEIDHDQDPPIAADPGREAVDNIRCGAHLTTGNSYYVGWPNESGDARS